MSYKAEFQSNNADLQTILTKINSMGGGGGSPDISYSDTFSDNSWSTIIQVCQTGKVPDTWVVGNSKTMLVNGKNYQIDIIGKYHDAYANGLGIAPLTLQFHDCYDTKYPMNSSASKSYSSCAMNKTHLPAILSLMPTEVRAGIKSVKKGGSYINNNSASTSTTFSLTLFLLCPQEVLNSSSASLGSEGVVYDYYLTTSNRIKKLNGTATKWWLRSPLRNQTQGKFVAVSTGGDQDSGASTDELGVAPAFCF